jgi:cytochrome P450
MLVMTDPPLHGAMRRAFNRLFLPRPVGRYESPGEVLVREILEGVLERGQCDFVVDLAARREKEFNLYTSPEKSDQEKLQKAVGWIKDPAKAIKPLTDVIDRIEDDQQSKQMLRTIIDDELATIKWLQETLALLSATPAA